MAARSVRY